MHEYVKTAWYIFVCAECSTHSVNERQKHAFEGNKHLFPLIVIGAYMSAK